MVLVDTSVWIDFLRGRATPQVGTLEALLAEDEIVATTPLVIQEVLQGADSPGRFDALLAYLAELACFIPRDPVGSHVSATRLYQECRLRGRTPRSSNDCLIAQVAIEHSLALLHDDRDFDVIAEATGALRIQPVAG